MEEVGKAFRMRHRTFWHGDEEYHMKARQNNRKSAFYTLNPERVIDEAIEREDWFSAFSNAVTYFEHWGYWRLRWYCIKEKIDIKERIKHLHVSSLVLILYLLRLIDTNTFSKINKTIKERNKLVHPVSTEAGITYRDRKEKDRATQLLTDAKSCIRKLKEGIGHD